MHGLVCSAPMIKWQESCRTKCLLQRRIKKSVKLRAPFNGNFFVVHTPTSARQKRTIPRNQVRTSANHLSNSRPELTGLLAPFTRLRPATAGPHRGVVEASGWIRGGCSSLPLPTPTRSFPPPSGDCGEPFEFCAFKSHLSSVEHLNNPHHAGTNSNTSTRNGQARTSKY